ncbi:MAG TPA: DUF1553 domain-containing protein [Planctomycetes bacterium]|nr:DUF1553 domain-containing protein [Fuerstiella sp.]HIK93161.1 DUF1553 domain-containing protein [Planctomycetota bacterium]
MPQRLPFLISCCAVFGVACATVAAEPGDFAITPTHVELNGNFATAQLLAQQTLKDRAIGKRSADLTHAAKYDSGDEQVVAVSETGQLLATGNGTTTVTVTVNGKSQSATIVVNGVEADPAIAFDTHIRPTLGRLGCNAGACHASQFGKGDFILSVVGFDPKLDHNSMVRDRQQRRVNLVQPEESLLLKKPTMQVPHGGGQRLYKHSTAYRTIVAWIESGAPGPDKDAATVEKLSAFPRERIAEPDDTQQLQVIAEYSDGSVRDVTSWAKFDSTDDAVLSVTRNGHVTVEGRGQAPIMVRFEGHADIAMFVSPYGPTPQLAEWKSQNFIDDAALQKFQELGITPSVLCDDATFVRRAYLDAIGTLPSAEECDAFVSSSETNKRDRLVDELLGLSGDPQLDRHNDKYAAIWTLKWSDLLRNTSKGQAADQQRMWAMHNWIKESFRTNKPFDQFVRELITAKGSIYSSGPASYFKINANSSDLGEATAQLFLGARLQCAKCHHHPFEKYSQADYYSFAAFFSRVGNKNSQEFGLFGRETVVMVKSTGDVRHPRTGQTLKPKPLDGEESDHELDRRIPLAEWLTSPDNRAFAKSLANRYVGYLLGNGLVEPVDDMRATNPPTNPAMLEALADHLIRHKFDLKQLIRVIMTSRLYQLSSHPTVDNVADSKFYSHYKVKRLSAEPLLDAVDYVTGTPTKFKGLPAGTRAIEIPDGEYPNYFLTTFGKPKRASVCECERMPHESLGQALHTINGDIVANKIADKNGRIAQLLATDRSDEDLITEVYKVTLCRSPSAEELKSALEFRQEAPSRKEFFEDLQWALLNNKQFLFVY